MMFMGYSVGVGVDVAVAVSVGRGEMVADGIGVGEMVCEGTTTPPVGGSVGGGGRPDISLALPQADAKKISRSDQCTIGREVIFIGMYQ
jgi:hypothetical protein